MTDVYSLMRLANSLGSSSSSLSLSLSSSHTFMLPFAMRHIGGGGSNGSSLVRAMMTMSSSSLDSSLDETLVTHSYFFHQEASLGVAFLLWEELGLLVMALLLPKFLVLFFLSSS